jgi:hypothetical protein
MTLALGRIRVERLVAQLAAQPLAGRYDRIGLECIT